MGRPNGTRPGTGTLAGSLAAEAMRRRIRDECHETRWRASQLLHPRSLAALSQAPLAARRAQSCRNSEPSTRATAPPATRIGGRAKEGQLATDASATSRGRFGLLRPREQENTLRCCMRACIIDEGVSLVPHAGVQPPQQSGASTTCCVYCMTQHRPLFATVAEKGDRSF